VRFRDKATWGEKYGGAMNVKTQEEADEWLKACIEHNMGVSDHTLEEATRIELSNIGYWTGYCGEETAERVMRLFNCSHPVFSKDRPITTEAYDAGLKLGRNSK
jgi:hypothetical protein